jgi:hypothetical protein
MTAPKTCVAPKTSTTDCPGKVVAIISLPVPGGTIRGASCGAHIEVVRAIVRDEAARRIAAVQPVAVAAG